MESHNYDIIIVGGGPTGLVCGIAAHKAGLRYLILEKGLLVNSIYNFPTNMTFFSTSQNLEVADVPFISHTDKPTRKEALEYYRRLAKSYDLKIQFRSEVDTITKNETSTFTIKTTTGQVYTAQKVIVATGFYDCPRPLDIPGENLPKVKHYYDDAHPYIGMDVLVIGARNSACDVALETWQKGARVTMAIRKDKLYDKVKYWILPNIQNRIKEGSIKALFETTVVEIKDKSVILQTPDGLQEIPNDYVLAMTGYMPNYPFFKRIGIQLKDKEQGLPQVNPDTLESNIPGLYLAGVIVSGLNTSELFIENTREHGELIVKHILEQKV